MKSMEEELNVIVPNHYDLVQQCKFIFIYFDAVVFFEIYDTLLTHHWQANYAK